MGTNVYWMQIGGCGGDSISFLNADAPDIAELFRSLDIDLLWHPSLSNKSALEHERMVADIVAGQLKLDVLIVEGSVIQGPAGSGLFDTRDGRPTKDIVYALAQHAGAVLAAGTCASFGGFGVDDMIESTGLQFCKRKKGGLLGTDFLAKSGQPVINLAGCPCHHDILAGAITAVGNGIRLKLDQYNRPQEWFSSLIHQGCTRNEYHEYRVEEEGFGEKGCMFFHMGCQGPLVSGVCNTNLWNQHSSKTRAGVPCFGCTSPDFPTNTPFFETNNIEGVPVKLPSGVDRAHYMVYKDMAAAAAPERLKSKGHL